jgi:diguanylate cyclase (GGDEF)-like protein
MQKSLRADDYLYRWGGEEFVILLPATDTARADIAIQNLHRTFKEADWSTLGIEPITLSVGVACFPDHGDEFNKLFKKADTAVYQAKNEGRDRTVFADL